MHSLNGSKKIQTEAHISAEPTLVSSQLSREGVHTEKESETDTESLAVVIRDDGPLEGFSVRVSDESKMEREDAPTSNGPDGSDVHTTERLSDQPPPAENDLHLGNQDDDDTNEGAVI